MGILEQGRDGHARRTLTDAQHMARAGLRISMVVTRAGSDLTQVKLPTSDWNRI